MSEISTNDAMAQVAARERRGQLEATRLYVIAPIEIAGRPAAEFLEPALRAGVGAIQLREKHADDETLLSATRALRVVCDRYGALLLINDRPDLALAAGADGVHVGQGDDPVDAVRDVVGPDLLIGISTHAPAEVEAAETSDADYLGVGPVYPTPTKPRAKPVGLELVRHAAAVTTKPFFAIGGLDVARVPAVAAAGARRVAVVRAVCEASDPEAAAASLLDSLEASVPAPPVEAAR